MKTLLAFLYAACVALSQIIPFDQTLPILTSPVAQVKAGDELIYQFVTFHNASCAATLDFQNSTFLPLSAIAKPKNCDNQVARFRIPPSAPNGAGALEWQCSGSQGRAIDLLVISGGEEDYDAYMRDRDQAVISVDCKLNGDF